MSLDSLSHLLTCFNTCVCVCVFVCVHLLVIVSAREQVLNMKTGLVLEREVDQDGVVEADVAMLAKAIGTASGLFTDKATYRQMQQVILIRISLPLPPPCISFSLNNTTIYLAYIPYIHVTAYLV